MSIWMKGHHDDIMESPIQYMYDRYIYIYIILELGKLLLLVLPVLYVFELYSYMEVGMIYLEATYHDLAT